MGRSPQLMRSTQKDEGPRFTLKVVPPFRLDLTVWALRRAAREQNGSMGRKNISQRAGAERQAGGNCRYPDRLNGHATTSGHRNWRTFRARCKVQV